MKIFKETDYREEYRQEMEILKQKGEPPTDREWKRFHLTEELVNAEESQFERRKNEEKQYQLEHIFYPALCEIAEIQGGRVELCMDEEDFSAELVYISDHLILDNTLCADLSDFSAIISAAKEIFISMEKRNFKIQFFFDMYDKVKVKDHSKMIAEINQKIQHHRYQNTEKE